MSNPLLDASGEELSHDDKHLYLSENDGDANSNKIWRYDVGAAGSVRRSALVVFLLGLSDTLFLRYCVLGSLFVL